MLVLVLVLVLASFAYSVYCTQTDMSAAFFSPLSRFWEIGAGCLAGFALSNARSKEVIDGWKATAASAERRILFSARL